MICDDMTDKVGTVAGVAVTTTHRHGRGLAISGLQRAVGGVAG